MNKRREFDIIIIGAGLSGLTLAVELVNRTEKSILILEKKKKFEFDKNWCFWSYPNNRFSNSFNNSWNKVTVKIADRKKVYNDPDIKYLRIKSSYFYSQMIKELKRFQNCKLLLNQDVTDIKSCQDYNIVTSNKSIFYSTLIFDSRPTQKKNKLDLVQHFYGLEIKFEKKVFQKDEMTLMDFQESNHGVHFFYVLPFSATSALIETTYFSSNIFNEQKYKSDLTRYINKNFRNSNYKVAYTEKGIIPMFPIKNNLDHNKYFKIGTPGNWVKLSTGFGFQNSFENAKNIVDKIIIKKKPIIKRNHLLFLLDLTFLEFLKRYSCSSNSFFQCLFFKNNYKTIVNFLIGKPTLFDLIKIIISLPKIRLIKCLYRVLVEKKYYVR